MRDMRNIETIRPSDEAINAEFTAHRQEDVFQEILQARSGVATSGSPTRRWPAIVAASIAGLVVLGFAAQALAPKTDNVVVPTNSESAPVQTPSNPPSRNTLSAAAMLGVVATTAASAPAAEPNTFLHVTGFAEQTPAGTDESPEELQYWSGGYDTYIDADGWMWSNRFGDDSYWLLAQQDKAFIDSLPAESAALEAELRSLEGNNSGDERVFKAIHEILITETAPAELRGAAISVLQRIAENPQDPETTKDDEVATPAVEVTEVTLNTTSEQGYRVSITDPTSRPGMENWLVLDATGQIAESGQSGPDGTYMSSVDLRERVDSLPGDFVEVLGTEQVDRMIDN